MQHIANVEKAVDIITLEQRWACVFSTLKVLLLFAHSMADQNRIRLYVLNTNRISYIHLVPSNIKRAF